MKVRLKNHDYANNIDAGTIFDALNERGGEFDYNFPYWHGWVKDGSGNRKFLSYSREDLELVLRPEIGAFFNKIESGQIVLEKFYEKYGTYVSDWPSYKYKNITIQHNQIVFRNEADKSTDWLCLSSEEALYFDKMIARINGVFQPNDQDQKLLERLSTL